MILSCPVVLGGTPWLCVSQSAVVFGEDVLREEAIC